MQLTTYLDRQLQDVTNATGRAPYGDGVAPRPFSDSVPSAEMNVDFDAGGTEADDMLRRASSKFYYEIVNADAIGLYTQTNTQQIARKAAEEWAQGILYDPGHFADADVRAAEAWVDTNNRDKLADVFESELRLAKAHGKSPNAVWSRILAMREAGFTDAEIDMRVAAGGWNAGRFGAQQLRQIEEEERLLTANGQYERALALARGRIDLYRNGGPIDPNDSNVSRLLAEQMHGQDVGRIEALGIAIQGGASMFLQATDRYFGQDIQDALEATGLNRASDGWQRWRESQEMWNRIRAETAEQRPVTDLAGSLGGGFIDPMLGTLNFVPLSLSARLLPGGGKLVANLTDDLIARGASPAIARATAQNATMDQVARFAASKYLQRKGITSLPVADTVGGFLVNAVTNAVFESGIGAYEAGSYEGANASDVAWGAFIGGATGALFGVGFEGLLRGSGLINRGVTSATRRVRGRERLSGLMGDNVPPSAINRLDEAIAYAREGGVNADETATRARTLAETLRRQAEAKGSKLTAGDVAEIEQSIGIRLDELPTRADLQAERSAADADAERFERAGGVASETALRNASREELTGAMAAEVQRLGGVMSREQLLNLDQNTLANAVRLAGDDLSAGDAAAAARLDLAAQIYRERFGTMPGAATVGVDPSNAGGRFGVDESTITNAEQAQQRIEELERRLLGDDIDAETRSQMIDEWESTSANLAEALERPTRHRASEHKLIRQMQRRIANIENALSGESIDVRLRNAMIDEHARLLTQYPEAMSRFDRRHAAERQGMARTLREGLDELRMRQNAISDAESARRENLDPEDRRVEDVLEGERPLLSRDEAVEQIGVAFRLRMEESTAVGALLDARAAAWSAETGRPASDWFATRIARAQRVGRPAADALFQTQDDGFMYRTDFRPHPQHDLPRIRRSMRTRAYRPGAVVHVTSLENLAAIQAQGLQPSPGFEGDLAVWASTVNDSGQVVGGALSYGRGGVPVVLELSSRIPAKGIGDVAVRSPGRSYVEAADIARVFVGDDPTPYTLDAAVARGRLNDDTIPQRTLFQEQPGPGTALGHDAAAPSTQAGVFVREHTHGQTAPLGLRRAQTAREQAASELAATLGDALRGVRARNQVTRPGTLYEALREAAEAGDDFERAVATATVDPNARMSVVADGKITGTTTRPDELAGLIAQAQRATQDVGIVRNEDPGVAAARNAIASSGDVRARYETLRTASRQAMALADAHQGVGDGARWLSDDDIGTSRRTMSVYQAVGDDAVSLDTMRSPVLLADVVVTTLDDAADGTGGTMIVESLRGDRLSKAAAVDDVVADLQADVAAARAETVARFAVDEEAASVARAIARPAAGSIGFAGRERINAIDGPRWLNDAEVRMLFRDELEPDALNDALDAYRRLVRASVDLADAADNVAAEGAWADTVAERLLIRASETGHRQIVLNADDANAQALRQAMVDVLGEPRQTRLIGRDAEVFRLTDAQRHAYAASGEGLWQRQQNRIAGSIEFLTDGRAVLRGLERPDISTAIHELGHLFRRDLSPEQHAVASRWAGVKAGDAWSIKAEERFARAFERYVRDGLSPTPALQPIFAKLASWLRGIYTSIRGTPISERLSDDLRGVFDGLFDATRHTPAEIVEPAPTVTIDPPTAPTRSPVDEPTTGDPPTRTRTPDADDVPTPPLLTDRVAPGRAAAVRLPGDRSLSVTYAAIEAQDIIPSHDARRQFARNPQGDANERNYSHPQQGARSRDTVRQIARDLRPELLLTDTPTATDGPPVMTQRGVVLGGNARTMGVQLAYHQGDAGVYRDAVLEQANKFGLDPERLASMKQPVVVRMLDGPEPAAGELSRVLNQPLTTPRAADTDVLSRARTLTPEAATAIGAVLGETPREAMNSPTRSAELLRELVRYGVFDEGDFEGLTDSRGMLNQAGRDVVERTMLASVVPDMQRLGNASPSTRNTLIRAIAPLSTIRGSSEALQFDVVETLGGALDAIQAFRTSGARSFDDLLSQQTLEPEAWRSDARVVGLARGLLDLAPTHFAKRMQRLAESAGDAASGQSGLFGSGDPVAGFQSRLDELFPVPDTRKVEPGERLFSPPPKGVAGDIAASRGPVYTTVPLQGATINGETLRVPAVLNPIPTPELVKLAKALSEVTGGAGVRVSRLRKARGVMRSGEGGAAFIEIDPATAEDPTGLAGTLAHEIGHLIDFLDDQTMKRGNLLGRIASLRPTVDKIGRLRGFMRNTYGSLWSDTPGDVVLAGTTNKELRRELLDFAKFWKPFDEAIDPPEYVKYRKKHEELYADALSAFLVSPGTLKDKAPRFFEALVANLDRKPEALRAYLDVQDLVGGTPESIAVARRADIREGFATAEELLRARHAEAQEVNVSVISRVRQLLYDKASPLLAKQARVERQQGVELPDGENAKHALDELDYRDGVNHAFLTRVERDIKQPLNDSDLSDDDFGEYLILRRVINERTDIANPYGHTPQTAGEQLANLAQTLGATRFAELERIASVLDDEVFEIAQEAVEVGVYSRKTFEEVIEPNRGNYATFQVIDYVTDTMPAGIRQQVGTFKGVANPFHAMLLKTISVNRAVELNRAKNVVRDFMRSHFPDEIKMRRTAPGGNPPRPDVGNEHLIVMENGRPVFYEVDKYIERAFAGNDIGLLQKAAQTIQSSVYRVFHPVYVTLSPSWQVFNLPRDMKRTYKMLAVQREIERRTGSRMNFLQVTRAYIEAARPAWQRARRRVNPLIEQMMDAKVLDVPFASYDFTEDSVRYDRLLQRYGLGTPPQARAALVRWVQTLARGVETIGVWTETVPKVAAWNILERAGMDEAPKRYAVRNYFGTPNYRKKGTATALTNGIAMYSNVIVQGLVADARIATRPKTAGAYWMRSILIDFLPKMVMRAAKWGAFGAGVKLLFDRIPEYDLANHIIVPLGTVEDDNGEDKTLYIRIPHDDTNRIFAVGSWLASQGDVRGSIGGMIGQLPFTSLSPPIEMTWKWALYAQGINPMDTFRRRQIVERDAWNAGGWAADSEMIRWTLDQFGVATQLAQGAAALVSKAGDQVGVDTEPVTGLLVESGQASLPTFRERTLNSTPGLGRVLRLTDRGISEAMWDEVRLQDAERAKMRLSLDADTKRLAGLRYRYNRLGEERLDEGDARRRAIANHWYRRVYLPLTALLKDAVEADDATRADAIRSQLKAESERVVELLRQPETQEQE